MDLCPASGQRRDERRADAASQAYLVSRAAGDNPAFQDQVLGLARRLADSGMSAPDAQRQAYARFYFTLQQQAQTLAYVDVY